MKKWENYRVKKLQSKTYVKSPTIFLNYSNMSTNIGIWNIPDTDDLIEVSESIANVADKIIEFLNTNPTSVKVITFVQNLFRPIL